MRMVEKLKLLIDKAGMTDQEFEVFAGLAKSRISKWYGGSGEPTVSQAIRMAKILKVNLSSLIDDEVDAFLEKAEATDEDKAALIFMIRRLGVARSLGRLMKDDEEPKGDQGGIGTNKPLSDVEKRRRPG